MSGKIKTNVTTNSNLYGGNGNVMIERLLDTEKLNGKCRMFSKVTIEPKGCIGYHVHTGETETYHIISGKGMYNDNGTEIPIHEGDTVFCKDGNGHGIINTEENELVFMALVILD